MGTSGSVGSVRQLSGGKGTEQRGRKRGCAGRCSSILKAVIAGVVVAVTVVITPHPVMRQGGILIVSVGAPYKEVQCVVDGANTCTAVLPISDEMARQGGGLTVRELGDKRADNATYWVSLDVTPTPQPPQPQPVIPSKRRAIKHQ